MEDHRAGRAGQRHALRPERERQPAAHRGAAREDDHDGVGARRHPEDERAGRERPRHRVRVRHAGQPDPRADRDERPRPRRHRVPLRHALQQAHVEEGRGRPRDDLRDRPRRPATSWRPSTPSGTGRATPTTSTAASRPSPTRASHVTQHRAWDSFGNAGEIVDPLGNVTTRTFDLRGRLRLQSDTMGRRDNARPGTASTGSSGRVRVAGGGSDDEVTETAYYPGGEVRSVKNANGAETTYTIDGLSRVVGHADPVRRSGPDDGDDLRRERQQGDRDRPPRRDEALRLRRAEPADRRRRSPRASRARARPGRSPSTATTSSATRRRRRTSRA